MNVSSHPLNLGRFSVPAHQSSLHLWRGELLRHARFLLENHGQLGVVARAGQGKTQFAAQLCRAAMDSRQGALSIIWLGCDFGDGAAAVLAADLVAAAQGVLPPGALDEAEALMTRMELDLRGWDAFVEGFYAALLSHLPDGVVLVLDDVHHLDDASALDLLSRLLRNRPARVQLLWLARHTGTDLAAVLDRDAMPILPQERLALTIDEIMTLYDEVYGQTLTLGEAIALHGATQGWTLGIVLGRFQRLEGRAVAGEGDGLMLDGLRRYFHDQYLARLPSRQRDFILALALLDYLPGALVRALAPDADSAAELDRLADKGFFVRREDGGDGAYILHQLFKAALAAEARTNLSDATRQGFLHRAACWHEQVGAWLLALGCYVQSADYTAMDSFCRRNFAALLALQEEGRIAKWLGRLAEAEQEAYPWLALARGLYPAQEDGPDTVARRLLQAESLFRGGNEMLGELRALLVMARRRLFGDMAYAAPEVLLERIRALRACCTADLDAVDHLLGALVEGQFGIMHAFDHHLVQNAVRPMLEAGMPDQLADIKAELVAILGHAECMLGNHRGGLNVLEQGHELLARANLSSWARFYLRMAHANTLGLLGRWAAFEQDRTAIMREPESLLNNTFAGPFLKIWDITRLTVDGDCVAALEMAQGLLKETAVAANPALRGQFQQYLAYAMALAGRHEDALRMASMARDSQALVPNAFFQLVNDLVVGATEVLCDRHDAGLALLDGVLQQQTVAGERALFEGALWFKALSLHRQGQKRAGLEILREALCLNRERGGYNFIWSAFWLPELLGAAVRHGIETEQAQRIARRICNGSLLDDGTLVPLLEIRTFGGFGVRCGCGKQLALSDLTPVQRRILGMLVLRPEQSVSVAEIIAALWPAVHGDSARASFDTALLRLRKLLAAGAPLNQAPYLVMQNGILSLRHARIDLWRVLHWCSQAEEHRRDNRPWQAEACHARTFELVKGRFFGIDLDCPEALALGQQLQDAIARAALAWQELLQRQGRGSDALPILHAAHAVVPAHGELARRLHDLQGSSLFGADGRVRAAQVLEAYRQELVGQGLSAAQARQLAMQLLGG